MLTENKHWDRIVRLVKVTIPTILLIFEICQCYPSVHLSVHQKGKYSFFKQKFLFVDIFESEINIFKGHFSLSQLFALQIQLCRIFLFVLQKASQYHQLYSYHTLETLALVQIFSLCSFRVTLFSFNLAYSKVLFLFDRTVTTWFHFSLLATAHTK